MNYWNENHRYEIVLIIKKTSIVTIMCLNATSMIIMSVTKTGDNVLLSGNGLNHFGV